ncbi:MAG TPA: DNA replication/repair protein RecF [Ktedonobacteraceae bacterium]|nr:DNA replication/repair protein RecF [Ktedonobacteraceae bacterium]
MYLSSLSLHEFRNYRQLELSLGAGLFLFYGQNAQGKTNLLEAVSMLATGSSFHATADREVVNWHAPEHIARLQGLVQPQPVGEQFIAPPVTPIQLEMVIFDPTPPIIENNIPISTVELPATTPRKRVKVNGVPRRMIDFIGQMKVVLFAPTDLHLVDGSPDERRRFLDRALCQVQPRYCAALVQYRKIVTQRSALLKRIRDNLEDPRMLDYLDDRLATLANMIIFERRRMLDVLNQHTFTLQETLSGGREHLQIIYRPSFKIDAAWNTLEAQQHYREQLRAIQKREILQGVCLLGPHRDDLEFLVNGVNMLTYGSRGQQRTTALSAKLAELAYMRGSTNDEPVLLLDDVFSELDPQRRSYLLHHVLQHTQVLLTATDTTDFPQEILQKAHTFEVIGGELKPA